VLQQLARVVEVDDVEEVVAGAVVVERHAVEDVVGELGDPGGSRPLAPRVADGPVHAVERDALLRRGVQVEGASGREVVELVEHAGEQHGLAGSGEPECHDLEGGDASDQPSGAVIIGRPLCASIGLAAAQRPDDQTDHHHDDDQEDQFQGVLLALCLRGSLIGQRRVAQEVDYSTCCAAWCRTLTMSEGGGGGSR
jgi:hypothetical protein